MTPQATKTKAKLHKTKNDLPQKSREKMVEVLQARLADSLDLMTQTKQAHWNVKGPDFIALHELFDKVHADVAGYVDDIAERLVMLGGTAHGTARDAAAMSSLAEYPHDIFGGQKHCEAMSSVLADYGQKVRAGIEQAEEAGDADTADLFTGVSRGIDQWLWFVEAHLQADN